MHRHHPYAGYDAPASGHQQSTHGQHQNVRPPPQSPYASSYPSSSSDPNAYQPSQTLSQAHTPQRYGPHSAYQPGQAADNRDYRSGPPAASPVPSYNPAQYGESQRPPIRLDPAVPSHPPPSMGPPIHMGAQMSRPPPATQSYQSNGGPSQVAPGPHYSPRPPVQASPHPSPSYDSGNPYQQPWSGQSVGSHPPYHSQPHTPQAFPPAPPTPAAHTAQASYNPYGGPSPAPAAPSSPFNYGGPSKQSSIGPDRRQNHRRDNENSGPYARVPPKQSRQASSHIDREDPRTAEEKPCRTLFVRNIDNSVDAGYIKEHFARFGDIKTYFELVAKRGICFITYYDLRGAELAKRECHAMEFNGRKVDVHYSLPKDQDTSKRCDRDQNQGTLFMLLKRYPRAMTDLDFRNIYQEFGEIRSIRRYKDQKNARFLEFYDSRACVIAHDAMGGKDWQDAGGSGQWDVKYAWDASMVGKGVKGSGQASSNDFGGGGGGAAGSEVGRAPPPPGHPAASAYGPSIPPPAAPMPPPPQASAYGASGGYGGPAPYNSATPAPAPQQHSYGGYQQQNQAAQSSPPPPPPQQWGSNPYAPAHLQPSPAPAPQGSVDPRRASANLGPSAPSATPPSTGGQPSNETQNRFEQAQKVQQLLASLSGGGGGSGGSGGGSNNNSGVTAASASGADNGTSSTPSGLPANLASLLAGVGASLGNGQNAGPPSATQIPSASAGPGPSDPRAAASATPSTNNSAQEAQSSIAAMLSLLQSQQSK